MIDQIAGMVGHVKRKSNAADRSVPALRSVINALRDGSWYPPGILPGSPVPRHPVRNFDFIVVSAGILGV